MHSPAQTERKIRAHLAALMDAATNCWCPAEGKRLAEQVKIYREQLDLMDGA